MASPDLRDEASGFFDGFVSAFSQFDGDLIARRYAVPYLAMNADGSSAVFASRQDIGHYFQGVLDEYRRSGCRSCRYDALDVVPLGARCLLVTVGWQLLRDDASELVRWSESYQLTRGHDGLRIFASVDHAESG